ncbi:type II secretion system protein GspG [Tahibacter harae]|uniref:Type II secretion system protein GspG n=1 Tax=Tahibacter harae TaxID=2963937 RepID=A0ABT1QPT1_9GAMM|nr:type II secretion system protein GspG [Tahibacter harae]MCQ4164299.1 type II secretion system protein GspG [Tahibacter harae]
MAHQDSMRCSKNGGSAAATAAMLVRRYGDVLREIALLLGLAIAVLLLGQASLLRHAPYSPVFRYEAELRSVAAAIEHFQAECGVLPARLRDLTHTAAGPAACQHQSLAAPFRLRDAWGSAYHYAPAAGSFTLRSAGRDRVIFTADDIVLGDTAWSWRPLYRPPTDWLRLSQALATVLLAVLFVTKLLSLLWRGGMACGRSLLRQRLSS